MANITNIAKAQSFFTIIDDDTPNIQSIAAVKKVADANNVKMTFAAISANLQQSQEIIDTLLIYQQQGFDVINHSLTHDKEIWSNGDVSVLVNEITKSQNVLDSLGFTGARFIVYPFGKFRPSRRDTLKCVLSSMALMAFDSRGNYNRLDSFDKFYISRLPLRRHDNLSIIKHIIDKAVNQNSWIVFFTHSGNKRDFLPEYLDEIIKYCKRKDMECLTVTQAYDRLKNIPQKDNRNPYTTIDDIFDTLLKHSITLTSIIILTVFFLIIFLKVVQQIKRRR